MGKVAIITDSNSGITQNQALELGIFVLPMPFMIAGEEYFEDITLTQNQFYVKLQDGNEISTSQPAPEQVMKLWNQVLTEYDEIVHIPMSSGLSGSCQSATMLSHEDAYEGKVFVVNNQRISVTMRQSVLDAKQMVAEGMSAEAIKNRLEEVKFQSSIYIMLDTLYYLKKGGRITPAAAAIGTMLKLKPVLQIQGEKLDAFAKARTTSAAKRIMIDAIKSDIENRFGKMEHPEKHHLAIAYSYDLAVANDFRQEVEEAFPGWEIHMDPLSLSVSCHIGPGSIALAVSESV